MKTAAVAVGGAAVVLFALEPFVGKVLLPSLGGTPMVWNTCVLTFQALLLAGYLYSVWVGRLPARLAQRIHVGLGGAAVAAWWFTMRWLWDPPALESPVLRIAVAIVVGVGAPFIVLSATSPLVQVWLARGRAVNVHRLYVASNIGSVVGLMAYVAVLEPVAGLHAQATVLWALLLVSVALTLGVAARTTASRASRELHSADTPEARVPPRSRHFNGARVFLLSGASSLCLYAVNTYLTTDVASFPLLFVIPLATFLLAFAAGFSAWAERHLVGVKVAGVVAAGAALCYLLRVAHAWSSPLDLPMPIVGLAGVVLALSAALAESRPRDLHLPAFYVAIGVGGVAAGLVAVVVVPWSWTSVASFFHTTKLWIVDTAVPEYPLSLVLAMALIPRRWLPRLPAVVALVLLLAARAETYGMTTLFQERNFYGTVRVQDDPSTSAHRLKNGTTLHGFQITSAPDVATSYYHEASPIGQLMRRVHPHRVTAFGLGAGTLAAYATRGDEYQFLEINPLVAAIANEPDDFTFLTRARLRGAWIGVRLGDGRLLAAQLPARSADLIVLDAFSSDSIPVHMVTREALSDYARLLAPDGVVAVHVSNRFFDLGPSVAATAEASGWRWWIQSRDEEAPDESASTWLALVLNDAAAERWGLTSTPWEHFAVPPGVRPWTDDWADLIARLKPVAEWRHTTFW